MNQLAVPAVSGESEARPVGDHATPARVNFYVTDAAAHKVKELVEGEGDAVVGLRIHIQGGGCSGFKYEFSFDQKIEEDDKVIVRDVPEDATGKQIRILIDFFSFQYLDGAELDYKNDLEGERFIIRNPNAKTTCGCGSSFDA